MHGSGITNNIITFLGCLLPVYFYQYKGDKFTADTAPFVLINQLRCYELYGSAFHCRYLFLVSTNYYSL